MISSRKYKGNIFHFVDFTAVEIRDRDKTASTHVTCVVCRNVGTTITSTQINAANFMVEVFFGFCLYRQHKNEVAQGGNGYYVIMFRSLIT